MNLSKEMALLATFKKASDRDLTMAIDCLLEGLLSFSDCPECPGWSGRWRAGIDDIEYMTEKETQCGFVGHGVAWSLHGHPVEFDLPVRMELAFNPQSCELVDGWIEIGAPYSGAGIFQNFSREKICDAVRVQAMAGRSKLQIIWKYRFSYTNGEWSMTELA